MSWYKKSQDVIDDLLKELEDNDRWIPVESSFITHVSYYEPLGMFEVKMNNGRSYSFRDVPKSIYDDFMQSESKGKYFNSIIRSQYKFK